MTAEACLPPEGTPDGALCWLRCDAYEAWAVMQWSHPLFDRLWSCPGVANTPELMALHGYRFHSIATPPEVTP